MKAKMIKSNPQLLSVITGAFYQYSTNALPTKKARVEGAFGDLVRELGEVEPETRYLLETLAGYLFTTNPAAPTNNLEWLARMAANRDDSENRVWLKYVYATEEYIQATDGRIMGRVPNAGQLEPGYYVPFLMERLEEGTEGWAWPNTSWVVDRKAPTEKPLTRDSFVAEELARGIKAWTITVGGVKYAWNEVYMKKAFGHPCKQPPSETHLLDGGNLRLVWPDESTVVIAAMRL